VFSSDKEVARRKTDVELLEQDLKEVDRLFKNAPRGNEKLYGSVEEPEEHYSNDQLNAVEARQVLDSQNRLLNCTLHTKCFALLLF